MPRYSKSSNAKKRTCHHDIQMILDEAIKVYDIKIIEGIRADDRQAELFKSGKSKCDGFINKSKHQRQADGYSHAVDIMPYPIDWQDSNRFFFMAGVVIAISERLYAEGKINHKIRWGHDWDSDRIFTDQTFIDSPHFELYKP